MAAWGKFASFPRGSNFSSGELFACFRVLALTSVSMKPGALTDAYTAPNFVTLPWTLPPVLQSFQKNGHGYPLQIAMTAEIIGVRLYTVRVMLSA